MTSDTTRQTDVKQFRGLSTDPLPPNEKFPDVPNGSEFYEMDTELVGTYDKENDKWYGLTERPEPEPPENPENPEGNEDPEDPEPEDGEPEE